MAFNLTVMEAFDHTSDVFINLWLYKSHLMSWSTLNFPLLTKWPMRTEQSFLFFIFSPLCCSCLHPSLPRPWSKKCTSQKRKVEMILGVDQEARRRLWTPITLRRVWNDVHTPRDQRRVEKKIGLHGIGEKNRLCNILFFSDYIDCDMKMFHQMKASNWKEVIILE